MPFLDFWQFLASEMGLKEDPQWLRGQWATRCLCPQSPFLSLLSHQPWNWRVSLFNQRSTLLVFRAFWFQWAYLYFVCWSFFLSCPKGGLGNTWFPMSWDSYWKTRALMVKMSRDSKGKNGFHSVWNFFFFISFKYNCFLGVYLFWTRILCLFGIWVNFWIICSYNSHFWETWI